MRLRSLALALFSTFTFSVTPASSQDFSSVYAGVGQAGLITNQTAITQAAIGRRANETASRNARNILVSVDEPALIHKVSMSARRNNLAAFVKKTRATDPTSADNMEKLFSSTDVIGMIGKGIAPYGLRTNNVADAYTVYWTNAWLGSRGRSDTLSKSQINVVRSQAANALMSTPEFGSASDAQKQEMAEALLVQAALIEASVEKAKSDPEFMAKVKSAIIQGAKGMGLDLYKMTLTNDGFVPAKKGSAVDDSDTIPGTDVEEQALTPATPPAEKDSSNYALIAAAGGAGLGGMLLLGKAMGRKS